MRRVREVSITLVCISIIFSFGFRSMKEVNGNPYTMGYVDTGQLLTRDGNASMPEAYVTIDMLYHPIGSYDVNISCAFYVQSNYTRNSSIGFVYPDGWETSGADCNFSISIDSQIVPYYITGYSSLNLGEEWRWLHDHRFVVFNISYQAGELHVLKVNKTMLMWGGDVFYFNYIVGTARSWIGNTHEIVKMHLYNYSSLLSYSFSSETWLNVTKHDNFVNATWDFTINEFDSNFIEFYAKHSVWKPPQTTSQTTSSTTITNTSYSQATFGSLNYALPGSIAFVMCAIVVAVVVRKKAG